MSNPPLPLTPEERAQAQAEGPSVKSSLPEFYRALATIDAVESELARLRDELAALRAHVVPVIEMKRLKAELARLREALEFYADEKTYKINRGDLGPEINGDTGDIARAALAQLNREREETKP